MVRSPTPPSVDLDAIWPTDVAESAGSCVAVAYSGGRDSTALLHATARMAREHGGIEVLALHVHHGLSSHADAWLEHAQAQCQQWADEGLPITLHWRHLHLSPAAGQSIEALARSKRYEALAQMAQHVHCDLVLLAHHQQDQAETFLLQALRGAGLAGLAAMPREAWRQAVHWARPWLNQPSQAIEAYIQHHGLRHIQDDSNTDVRFARNRLRHQVWPALSAAFAQSDMSLAQSASNLSDVLACHDDWLAQHLCQITPAELHPGHQASAALVVSAWRGYAAGPQRELLRAWFRQVSGHFLPASWVNRLQREIGHTPARWPIQLWRDGEQLVNGYLTLYRDGLSWQTSLQASMDQAEVSLCIEEVGSFAVPQAHGTLLIRPVAHAGVSLQRLLCCQLRSRQEGVSFQLAPDRPIRSIKKQFQSAGMPAWARQAPLLWSGQALVFVPGLGIDARVWAAPEEPQVSIDWLPDADKALHFGSSAVT